MSIDISEAYLKHLQIQLPSLQLGEFIASCQTPLRKSIRVNSLKISVADFLKRMAQYQWKFFPIPWCQEGFWIERPEAQEESMQLGNYLEHLLGLFYIQEASSMLPPEALINTLQLPPELILDVAAAPGSKTTQLIAKTHNKSLVVANELSSSRLRYLHGNLCRLGCSQNLLTHKDGREFGCLAPNTFDAILLDAPCTGEGTIRKNHDALKNWDLNAVIEMMHLQKELIQSAFSALKPGGHLVYSTCTLSQEENHQVCQSLLDSKAENCEIVPLNHLFEGAEKAVTSQGYLHILPHIFDSEGFFVACFKKMASNNSLMPPTLTTGASWQPLPSKTQVALIEFLQQQFSWTLALESKKLFMRQQDKFEEIWLFPSQINSLPQNFPINRCGIKLGECRQKGKRFDFRLNYEFAIAFGQHFQTGCYALNTAQLEQVIQGKDVDLTETLNIKGDCLMCYQGFPVGLSRVVNMRLKNNLPRELIKDNWRVELLV